MKRLILLAALVASPAMADTLNQSGVGNTSNQNSYNNSGNTNSGNSSAKAYSNASASAYQHQSQNQSLKNTNDNSNDGNKQNTTITDRKQAPALAAPSLTSGMDTCLGSASMGGSIAGFGITGGSTMIDENCVRLKNSARAQNMGYKRNALYIMCLNDDFRKGQRLESDKCPQDAETKALDNDGEETVKSDFDFLNIKR